MHKRSHTILGIFLLLIILAACYVKVNVDNGNEAVIQWLSDTQEAIMRFGELPLTTDHSKKLVIHRGGEIGLDAGKIYGIDESTGNVYITADGSTLGVRQLFDEDGMPIVR